MHKTKTLFIYSVVAVALLITIIFIQTENIKSNPISFAQCLTDQGFILAGTDWCGHCESQKALFGNAVKYLDFRNCEDSTFCDEQELKGFPAWVLPDGEIIYGVQSLNELSELSECELNNS